MEKSFLKFGIFLIIISVITSCDFKDKGVPIINPLTDILIDTTGIPLQHSVEKDSFLILKPHVTREGISDDKFSYSWILTMRPGADFSLAREISTERSLNVPIDVDPSTDYYSLWYKVTDNTTGLAKGIIWRVVVQPPTNQGLVVADSDDGMNSDLSVIQDTLFTTNWIEKETEIKRQTLIKRNEFSRVNNRKITGVIHSLFAQRLFNNGLNKNFLHGAARNNAFRLNTLSYTMTAEGRELFYDAEVDLNIDYYFQNGLTQAWIMNSGKVSSRLSENATFVGIRKFSVNVPGNYKANKAIAVHPTIGQSAIFYDETLGRFLRFGTTLNTKAQPLESPGGTTPFAANNLPGYKVLGGGLGADMTEQRFVLRRESDNYVGVFCLTYTAAPIRQIDISAAPEIQNAISFVFPSDQAVIYYATSDKVYSIRIPAGGIASFAELYTSPEPITKLEMLRRSGTIAVPYSERCLIAVTYNGEEGKVTALPIPAEGLGLGVIDLSRKVTFGGFKKISAVAVQE